MATAIAEAKQLAVKKLLSSGLAETDLKLLRLTPLEANQVAALDSCFKPVPALRINYHHPLTGKPLSPWPSWPPFYRLRYLKAVNDFSSRTLARPIRFVQPPDSGVCAYFPTNYKWAEVLGDPTQPLIITEGELKAAKACKEGYACVGLGGVNNFKSNNLGIAFLKELEEIRWVKRAVYIIYDSDFRTNDNICAAVNALADELLRRGAMPHFVALPDLGAEGEKTGLDDYLIACKNKDDLANLIRDNAESITLSQPLWQLNEKVLYVQDPGLVLRKDTNQKISPTNFTNHAFKQVSFPEKVLRPDGSISLKMAPAAMAWLSWPFRSEVHRLTYAPGEPQRIAEGDQWNVWPGWGCEPRKGDVSLFLRLIDHLFAGATKEEKLWFLRWLAYPIQHPGTKMFTTVLIHGRQQGTGKSLIGYTMGAVYGQNFTEIKQHDLENSFTEWAENKQFILADDVTGTDSRHHADILKSLITQKNMRINIKYVPSYTVPDCVNYLFTSNQPDAFFLENDDRRTFIWEVTSGLMSMDFYSVYDTALNVDKTLGPVVFDYLLNLDLGDFNPTARALTTQAKENMISDAKSDLGTWVDRLKLDPENVLRVGKVAVVGDLFTSDELLRIYDSTGSKQVTANGLGRELRRAGIPMWQGGRTVKTKTRGIRRFYVIRNHEKWQNALPATVARYVDSLI